MNAVQRISWTQLREFSETDLTKSFVLSWGMEGAALVLDVDLLLLPGHPSYETPRPAEKVCIRPAKIEFPYCEQLSIELPGAKKHAEKAIADLPIGPIYDLQKVADGHYEITGSFGEVRFESERPVLRLGH